MSLFQYVSLECLDLDSIQQVLQKGTPLMLSGDIKVLHDFTYFYGAIPTSSAPIVFASQFDPEAAELIATAVHFGLILAGPIMFITAYSLKHGETN